jgi:hypothetical protein
MHGRAERPPGRAGTDGQDPPVVTWLWWRVVVAGVGAGCRVEPPEDLVDGSFDVAPLELDEDEPLEDEPDDGEPEDDEPDEDDLVVPEVEPSESEPGFVRAPT